MLVDFCQLELDDLISRKATKKYPELNKYLSTLQNFSDTSKYGIYRRLETWISWFGKTMTIFVLWIQEMRWLEVVNKNFIIHNLKRAFICNKNRENAILFRFYSFPYISSYFCRITDKNNTTKLQYVTFSVQKNELRRKGKK